MNKRSTDNGSMNGLPTAIAYMGMFAVMGCLSVFLFLLFTGAFFWGWMRLCDWSVLAAALPSKGTRFGLGLLIYLLIVRLGYVRLRKSEGITEREAARLRQKETASMQHRENARAQDKAILPVPHSETVLAVQGEVQSSLKSDLSEAADGAQAAVTKETAEAAPQTGLRFDGVYVAEEDAGRLNDYASGALVTARERSFLRFYSNGRVCSTSRRFPVTAPATTLLTPEEAFVKLEQLVPTHASVYTFTGDNLSFQVGSEDYQITQDGLTLRRTYFTKPDPYGSDMSDEIVTYFAFVKIAILRNVPDICSCQQARQQPCTAVMNAVVDDLYDQVLATSERLTDFGDKSLYRCRVCGMLWVATCYTSGQMDIYYLFPVPQTNDPIRWLREQAVELPPHV